MVWIRVAAATGVRRSRESLSVIRKPGDVKDLWRWHLGRNIRIAWEAEHHVRIDAFPRWTDVDIGRPHVLGGGVKDRIVNVACGCKKVRDTEDHALVECLLYYFVLKFVQFSGIKLSSIAVVLTVY